MKKIKNRKINKAIDWSFWTESIRIPFWELGLNLEFKSRVIIEFYAASVGTRLRFFVVPSILLLLTPVTHNLLNFFLFFNLYPNV